MGIGTAVYQPRNQTARRTGHCAHERTRFHSIQRLGTQPPIELRQCLLCNSTIAVPLGDAAPSPGVAAGH
jgi:hypothetical protein